MHPTSPTIAILCAVGLLATAPDAIASQSIPSPHLSTSSLSVQSVPEFRPVAAVILSSDLLEADYRASELIRAIVEADAEAWVATPNAQSAPKIRTQLASITNVDLTKVHTVVLPHANIWLRDYGPWMLDESGALRFIDFDFNDGAPAFELFPKALAKVVGARRDNIPLEIDGGNFLAARDHCFTSVESPLPQSSTTPPELTLAARFASTTGCKQIIALRDPPHPHLDMWMKVVSDGSVLVNELDHAAVLRAKELSGGELPRDIMALKANLDAQAKILARYVKVDRIPMPLPYRGTFRTYTNAALVNGVAILPAFERFGWGYEDYPDGQLKAHYEQKAADAYARHGFRVRFIPSDGLIFNGGALHCILLQIPRLPRLNANADLKKVSPILTVTQPQ